MARNGRPADHSCQGSRGTKTQGGEQLFEFHTLQTRAYDFPPIQNDFLDLLSHNAPTIFLGPKVQTQFVGCNSRGNLTRRAHLILAAGPYGKALSRTRPALLPFSLVSYIKRYVRPRNRSGRYASFTLLS